MHPLPQRLSLVSQTALILKQRIQSGEWREWLPGERALCETLQISRNTVRSALRQLEREGVTRALHGAGNRILGRANPKAGALQSRDVGCLVPVPLEQLRPAQALWIDALRAMLNERGCRLHLFHGPQYFRAQPAAALEKLTSQNPHRCWILALASAGCQQWFQRKNLRCVIAGSCHAEVDLPFRDLDHRAMCRHAAGILLARGHRRLALVLPKTRLAGDIESEAGFAEGVEQSGHTDAAAIFCRHDATAPGIAQALRRLFEQDAPPTGLLVVNPNHYLTVASRLGQLGRAVPRDISIISRDEDPFLSFVWPRPACYLASPPALAKSLLRPVLELLEGGVVSQRAVRLMPKFSPGETVGSAPA